MKRCISKALVLMLILSLGTQHVAVAGGMFKADSATLAAPIQLSQPSLQQSIAFFVKQNKLPSPFRENNKGTAPKHVVQKKSIRDYLEEKEARFWSGLKNFWFNLIRSPQQLRRSFITIPLTLIVIAVSANAFALNSVALTMENDCSHIFLKGPTGSDEQYTSGLKLTFFTDPSADTPFPWINKLPLFNKEKASWFFDASLGQGIFTPGDTYDDAQQWESRPYAGITYFEWALNNFHEKAISSLIIDIGLIGP